VQETAKVVVEQRDLPKAASSAAEAPSGQNRRLAVTPAGVTWVTVM
jgi:hypothetical protein